MPNPPVGSADWTNGVVSAQMELGSIGAGAAYSSFNIPPNCETLIFSCPIFALNVVAQVVGNQSGMEYPIASIPNGGAVSHYVAYCPVQPDLDTSVTVYLTIVMSQPVYVTSDQGIRQVIDMAANSALAGQSGLLPPYGFLIMGKAGTESFAIEVDTNGRIIPLVPTTSTSPILIGTGAAATSILAAPVNGTANYLFQVTCLFNAALPTSGNNQVIADTVHGEFIPCANNSLSAVLDMKGRRTTTAVQIGNNSGANAYYTVSYANAY